MKKKVNIIGAGLAGLSTGIYLQEKGIQTEIFEMAGWAGGVCTTWIREGFRFDGCIHWMVGTKPGDEFYKLYREVDALKEDTEIYNAEFIQIEISGKLYNIPLKIGEFRKLLLSISSDDSERIEQICSDINTMIETKMPVAAPKNIKGLFKIIKESRGFLKITRKYIDKTVGEVAKSFNNTIIRDLINHLMPSEYTAMALFMMLGERMGKNAGYPLGGAWDMIRRMEAKYYHLGGKINFNTKVDRIIVEDGKANALIVNGITYPSDFIVAACDINYILNNMLGSKYHHPELEGMLKDALLFTPLAIISFGLNKRFDIPFAIHYQFSEGIEIAPGIKEYDLDLRSFDFDPAAAPDNCSSVMVMLQAPLDYWLDLRKSDIGEYRMRKQKLCEDVADLIEKRIPGFKDAIIVTDVATPATYVRLANLYQASFEGFAPTPQAIKAKIMKTIPGIEGLYLAGQWTTPGGGICTAILSGKEAAEAVLKKI